MVRNVIGSVLALLGATAAVLSPFLAWNDGRLGRHYRIADLFGGITAGQAALWTSVLLPLAFAALLTLVGVALRSRLLVTLAGVIVLGFTVLWMVRLSQVSDGLTFEGANDSGLGWGVVLALAGGVLLLLGAAVMGRRPGRLRRRSREAEAYAGGPYDGHDGGRYAAPYGERDDGRHGERDDPYREDPYRDEQYGDPYGRPPDDPYGRPPGDHGQGPPGPPGPGQAPPHRS
ncbi:hypothetical protein [Streptomyces sp. NRRL S-118]|uniref:hypothetical protein n=1 Tax=Streptomyces sp. NRRL S-118 TaxID=1463881 RepID=UPI0004C7A4EF|nr:hypothetical protein [Streptomyces sp. NRRL S-118]